MWSSLGTLLALVASVCYFFFLFFFIFFGGTIISWEISDNAGIMSLVFIFDEISLSFFLMVCCVSSVVFFYSLSYMGEEVGKNNFMFTLFLFVLSIFILSSSGNLVSAMVGWDGLGLSSFCLIIFYQSWNSLGSGIVTFLTNRIGDIFLILSIIYLLLSSGESSGKSVFSFTILLSILLLITSSTNSAQLPFSAWLPLAMAAPTPVSSLVHSSTLVTAGVFLLIRFNELLSYSSNSILFFSSAITIILAGISSLFEMDFNKVVALSTLSHIALIILLISIDAVISAITHIMMHAFFNSLLFMCVGEIIHNQTSWQDVRVLRISLSDFSLSFSFFVSCASITGLPFLSGYFSKEVLLTSVESNSSFLLTLIFCLAVFFTASYSARIFSWAWFLQSEKSSSLLLTKSKNRLLLLWSIFSLISSGGFLSLWPVEGGEVSMSYVSTVFFLVFLGGFFGIFLSLKKTSNLSFLFGGGEGMWSLLPLTLSPVQVSWNSSLSWINSVDFIGLSSFFPDLVYKSCVTFGEVVEWKVKFAPSLFVLFSSTISLLFFLL